MPDAIVETPILDAPVATPEVPASIVDTPAAPAAPVEPAKPTVKILRRGDQIVEETPQDSPVPPIEPDAAPPAPVEATPATPPAPAVEEPEEVDFFPYAAEQTKGQIKTPEDVFALLEERNQLKKQLAERPQIEFPNEQAKWLYEQAIKFPGQEQSSFRSMLHVLSLDVTKLSDKEKQFEAFALENKDFTREEAREFFEATYEKNFGQGLLETDKVAQYQHRIETKKAADKIQQMQQEFNKIEPSKPAAQVEPQGMSPEEKAAQKQDVTKVLGQFGGVRYQFMDDPNSLVNVQMEDAELATLENYMTEPHTFFEDLTKECMDDDGNFSNEALAMALFEFKNRHRIREQAWKAGVNFGKLEQIKLTKNTANPTAPSTPPPAAPAKPSFRDAFRDAVKPMLNPART